MRRGELIKAKNKTFKEAVGHTLENTAIQRRNIVDDVLTLFKSGNRDVNQAIKMISEGEGGS